MKKKITIIIFAVVLLLTPLTVKTASAAEYGSEIYPNGAFNNFFSKDFNLKGFYNSWLSLAGTTVNGSLLKDSYAYVSSDLSNTADAGNRVLKLGYSPSSAPSATDYKFNSVFAIFKNAVPKSSTGNVTVSFDARFDGWENLTSDYDKKLWIMLENTLNSPLYFICNNADVMLDDNVFTFGDFPESGTKLPGYRRVSVDIPASLMTKDSGAVTFWFYNGGSGRATALIDNVSVKYNNKEYLAEGSFESFDMSNWANPSADALADPFENWGITWGEQNSPCKIVRGDGNAVLKFSRSSGTKGDAKTGQTVNFGLGIKPFLKAGKTEVSFDLKVENASGPVDTDYLNMRIYNQSSGNKEISVNILKDDGFLYSLLPESDKPGYKRFSYIVDIAAGDESYYDCFSLDFNTEGKSLSATNVLYVDNISFMPVVSMDAKIYAGDISFDRAGNMDTQVLVNFSSSDLNSLTYVPPSGAAISLTSGFNIKDNILTLENSLLKSLSEDGIYAFTADTVYGKASFNINVSGISLSPVISGTKTFNLLKPEDIVLILDIKGQTFIAVKLYGITLKSGEYELSADKTALTLKKDFLLKQIEGPQVFEVVTSGGSASFTIEVIEKKDNKLPIIIGITCGAVVLLGAAALTVILIRKKKKT